MNTSSINAIKSSTDIFKQKANPAQQAGDFQNMLQQSMTASQASDTTKANYVSQIFNNALEKPKTRAVRLAEDDTLEAKESLVSDDNEKAAVKNIKSILTGILEESGMVKPEKNTNTPYLGALPKDPLKKDILVSQLPTQNTPQNILNRIQNRQNGNQQVQNQNAPSVTPFQIFLDKAVDFFETVSDYENKSDTMMQDYIEGKMSLEEITVARTKVGLAISFSITLINQVTQTFKEIQNMQV